MKNTLLLLPLLLLAFRATGQLPATAAGSARSEGAIVMLPRKSQAAQAKVTIDWLAPQQAEVRIQEVAGKVEIKVRIAGKGDLTLDQIEVYVNNKNIKDQGNKADEVNLLNVPQFNNSVLIAQIPVTPGDNRVRVEALDTDGTRYFAEMLLQKQPDGIRVGKGQQAASGPSGARAVWIQPDLLAFRGKMFDAKTAELDVSLSLVVPVEWTLQLANIQVVYNNALRKPSPTAQLLGGQGNYSFRDKVTLAEGLETHEIRLLVRTPVGELYSEQLNVNYSPSRPNLYLLAIGTQLNLRYAAKDARDFAAMFAKQARGAQRLYGNAYIDTLLGPKATTSEIRGQIENIRTKLKTGAVAPDDIIMLFLSSHGFMDEQGDFRIQGNDYNTARSKSTSVSYRADILDQLKDLPCKKIIFLDACHSGGAKSNSADILNAIQTLKNADPGLMVITSSRDKEYSYEDVKWQNGAFTEALIDGLQKGRADTDRNSIIGLQELEDYIRREVPRMVREVKGSAAEQNPQVTRKELVNLPIFLKK